MSVCAVFESLLYIPVSRRPQDLRRNFRKLLARKLQGTGPCWRRWGGRSSRTRRRPRSPTSYGWRPLSNSILAFLYEKTQQSIVQVTVLAQGVFCTGLCWSLVLGEISSVRWIGTNWKQTECYYKQDYNNKIKIPFWSDLFTKIQSALDIGTFPGEATN